MLVQHEDHSAAVIGHPVHGEFHSEGNGVFDVPDDLADELTKFSHWNYYYGEPEAVAATAEDRIAELESQLAKLRGPRKISVRKGA